MFRTRDFILYVLVLLFLIAGATTTSLIKRADAPAYAPSLTTVDAELVSVDTTMKTSTEPSATLARLQAKLAAGEGERISAPPVLTSVDMPIDETVVSEATTTPPVPVQYCAGIQPHSITATWPGDATTRVLADEVVLFVQRPETKLVGSTTVTSMVDTTVLTLPRRTVRSNFDTCLPDTTIGVTPAGQLLDNRSAALYQQFSAEQVVGYTRDGFTVYGPATAGTSLDSCNGQYVAGVYQYHVVRDSDMMLPCYAGIPVALTVVGS